MVERRAAFALEIRPITFSFPFRIRPITFFEKTSWKSLAGQFRIFGTFHIFQTSSSSFLVVAGDCPPGMPGINIIITRLVGAAEYPFPFVVLARNFRHWRRLAACGSMGWTARWELCHDAFFAGSSGMPILPPSASPLRGPITAFTPSPLALYYCV